MMGPLPNHRSALDDENDDDFQLILIPSNLDTNITIEYDTSV